MTAWWPWDVLIILGAYHGLNPGMGWLFAVARGLQERRRSAVWESFLPIAIGHEAAIAVIVVLVAGAQFLIAPQALRIVGAVVLLGFALYRLWRKHAHPRGFGMRIGPRGLFGWSFLMSSAHGAGLMLVPILLKLSPHGGSQDMTLIAYTASFSPWQGLAAATLHTVALLVVMALVAGAQFLIAPQALRIVGAVALLGFGAYRLWRKHAHPRGFGMRIGARGLFGWSFLMSSAHGAGLMLVPILLKLSPHPGGSQDMTLIAYTASFSPWQGLAAATLHTVALLVVMALVAIVVYERFGVGFLHRAWLNVDLLWTVTLLIAGVITLFS